MNQLAGQYDSEVRRLIGVEMAAREFVAFLRSGHMNKTVQLIAEEGAVARSLSQRLTALELAMRPE